MVLISIWIPPYYTLAQNVWNKNRDFFGNAKQLCLFDYPQLNLSEEKNSHNIKNADLFKPLLLLLLSNPNDSNPLVKYYWRIYRKLSVLTIQTQLIPFRVNFREKGNKCGNNVVGSLILWRGFFFHDSRLCIWLGFLAECVIWWWLLPSVFLFMGMLENYFLWRVHNQKEAFCGPGKTQKRINIIWVDHHWKFRE